MGALLLALALAVAWFQVSHRADLRAEAVDALQAISRLKADQIAAWRRDRLVDAALFSSSPFFMEAALSFELPYDGVMKGRVLHRLGAVADTVHYTNVMLVDAGGEILLATSGPSPQPLPAITLAAIGEALRERRVTGTDLFVGPEGQPCMDLVAPLFLDEATLGVNGRAVVLRIDPNVELLPLVRSWPVPSASAESLLVRREGDEVLFLTDLRHEAGTGLRLRMPLDRLDVPAVMAVLGRRGAVSGLDYRGVKVLAALEPVPDSPWFLVAKMDAAEIFEHERARLLASGLVVSLLFVIVLLAFSAARRHRAEALRLAEREEKLSVTLRSIGDAVVVTDEQGRVTRLNPVAEALCGWSEPEALGQPVDQVLRLKNEDTRESAEVPVRRVLTTGHVQGLANHTILVARGGREHPIADSAAPIRLGDGSVLGVVMVFRDVSEERMRERALQISNATLEEANRALEAFSYSVSHDLRAPLRHAGTFARLLGERSGALDEKGRAYVEAIVEATDAMNRLIDALLGFSRVGRQALDPAAIDMDELLREAVAEASRELGDRVIEWRLAPLPSAFADPEMMRLVLANLLSNAVKYTRQRSPAVIEVGAEVLERETRYFVRDNGAGFDMRHVSRLFGVFERLHAADEFEGTGIGLANVRRIVLRHGGRVHAEGAVGQGATFSFTLPRSPGSATPASAEGKLAP